MTRHCKTEYSSQSSPSKDLPYFSDDLGHWSNIHYFGFVSLLAEIYIQFTNFLLKMFGKEYIYHANIAKELKKKNEDIYSQVMISIALQHSDS